MSDAEFFNPSEGGESYDPAAFERFKAQMKKNGQFVASQQKSEQRQKQKEDRLAKILLRFIQRNQKSGILILASRMMEDNIPPSFILSIILLGNEEIQEELKKEAGDVPEITAAPQHAAAGEFSIATLFSDHALPLKVKAEIDVWGKGILEAGSGLPFRVLETALDKSGRVKGIVIDSAAYVLQDFIEENGGETFDAEAYHAFCEFLMQGVMSHLRKQIENQKTIGEN